MNRKPLIITLIVIVAIALVVYLYFSSQPKVTTEQEQLDELHELSSQSKNNFTEQQKMDILDSLANQQSS